MFPILHGRHNLITKGWYFPGHGNLATGGIPCYVQGYRANVEPIAVPGTTPIYAGDTAIDLHFPVPLFDLNRTLSINLRLRSPSGAVFDRPAVYGDANTVIYPVSAGDIDEPGTWRYQISLLFRSGTFYHLDQGRFRVKANVPGVN